MEIGPLSGGTAGKPADPAEKPQPTPPHKNSAPVVDRLEISSEARARLGELADRELHEVSPPAPSDRQEADESNLDKVRRRIEEGFYDQPGAKTLIAKRLADDLEL